MKIIRLKKVLERTGLGRSTVYKKMANGTFPISVSLGGKSRGWVEEEVEAWIRACVEARDQLATSRPPCGVPFIEMLSNA